MKAVRQIFIISRFEIKTLLRSWFFRIFAFAGMGIITIFNLALLLADGSRWAVQAIPSTMPYMNLILVNVAQSIILAFLATEFMKRDRKLDTTEVIYIRSMSNGVYVLGKSVGTLIIFLFLNFLVLAISGTIDILMKGSEVSFMSYIVFPLLMSIPTLVYILGLSYVLMLLIRNQAVTFVVLMGYIGSTLFYLGQKFNNAFDYMAFFNPMLYSDIVGFADLQSILHQRGMYFFLGVGFIFLTILLISRLRQSKLMTTSAIATTIIFLTMGASLMVTYINKDRQLLSDRNEMRALESEYAVKPSLYVDEYDISVDHGGKDLAMKTQLKATNKGEDINSFFFTLNPGFEISELTVNGSPVDYERKYHIIDIKHAVKQGEKVVIDVSYQGYLDENATYLDIDEETRLTNYRVTIYPVGTHYGFIQENFVLLTPELKWYPSTRIAYNGEAGVLNPIQYSEYKLTVNTKEGLLAISQGKRDETSAGEFEFNPEYRLPQVSLLIGDYAEKTVRVDSIDYHVAMKKDHFYFGEFFENMTDTIEHTIRSVKNDFELELELSYPYKRFSIVEVPAQFVSFPREFTTAKEVMQPEMSFLPERGFSLYSTDFDARKERLIERNIERGNDMTDVEVEATLLKQFITSTLTINNQNNWFSEEGEIFTDTYTVFPSYYTFSNFVHSEDWPFFNKSFESYLYTRVNSRSSRWWSATTPEEDANIAMAENTFKEILQKKDPDLINSVIKVNGQFLFNNVRSDLGDAEFSRRLTSVVDQNKFKTITVDELEEGLYDTSEDRLTSRIKQSTNSTTLPGYLFSSPRLVEFKDGDRTRYLVTFKATNTRQAQGLLQLTFRSGGRGRGGGGGGGFQFDGGFRGRPGAQADVIERLVPMQPSESKKIDIILDEEPRMMVVGTFLSANLPANLNFPLNESEESESSFEEAYTTGVTPVILKESNEIVVDDRDEGFSVTRGQASTPLRALLQGDQETEEVRYMPMRWWAPGNWRQTVSANNYGDEVRSAYFIRTGDGSEVATWVTDLEDGGYYDVYVYMDKRNRIGSRDQEQKEQYAYTVFSDDGDIEVTVPLKDVENGWNHLGSYYISPGEAKITLSNKSDGRAVVADAVKWIKR